MAALRLATRRLDCHKLPPPSPFLTRRVSQASSPLRPLRTALYATALTVSAGLVLVYYFDARSAVHRYLITPVLRHAVDAETGHKFAVRVLKSGLAPRDLLPDNERLKTKLWDQELSNPIGLAAGFDKDGEAVDGLFNLGFSWVEIGSVTPQPQAGNPRPRVFHLMRDSAMINRYGFPSKGHAYVLSRLRARNPDLVDEEPGLNASRRPGSLLAVNLGKNKDSPADSIEDFIAGVKIFGPYTDVLVVNVSSPNTPGLRDLQNRKQLEDLLTGVKKARNELTKSSHCKQRILIKVAPDLNESQLVDIADVIRGCDIDGVIVGNTTTRRPPSLLGENKIETGGLSGPPLKQYSLLALRTLRAHLPARLPLIGCGGICTGDDALEYARAGASFVQVYTSFGYDGVGTCRRIKDELARRLAEEGTTWEEVVRSSVQKLCLKEPSTLGQA